MDTEFIPRLSIIIPVFNAEKYIGNCLDSILNQTVKDIEIICINDGSTDNSLAVLNEYAQKDNRIKVYSQKNKHSGVARNVGIKLAKGKYIHFVDADDLLYDDKVYENILKITEENNYPNVIRCKAEAFDYNTGEKVPSKIYEQENISKSLINKYINVYDDIDEALKLCVTPWGGIVKKKFLVENNIFFNNLKCCNDNSFFIEIIIHATNIYLCDLLIIKHTVHNPTCLISQRDKYFGCQYKSYDYIEKFLNKNNVREDIRKKILIRELFVPLHFYNTFKEKSKYSNKIYLSLVHFYKKIKQKDYEPYISSNPQFKKFLELKNENYPVLLFKYILKKRT